MKKIHFSIPVSVVWASGTVAALWAQNCDYLAYALLAMVIVGIGYALEN